MPRTFTQDEWDALMRTPFTAGSWVMSPDGVAIVAALPGSVLNPMGVAAGDEAPRFAERYVVHLVAEDGDNRRTFEEFEVDSFDPAGQPERTPIRRAVTEEREFERESLRRATLAEVPESRRPIVGG